MDGSSKPANNLIRVDVAELEADVAYFDARLCLVSGRPETSYKKAQIRTYQALEKSLSATLAALKKRQFEQKRAAAAAQRKTA